MYIMFILFYNGYIARQGNRQINKKNQTYCSKVVCCNKLSYDIVHVLQKTFEVVNYCHKVICCNKEVIASTYLLQYVEFIATRLFCCVNLLSWSLLQRLVTTFSSCNNTLLQRLCSYCNDFFHCNRPFFLQHDLVMYYFRSVQISLIVEKIVEKQFLNYEQCTWNQIYCFFFFFAFSILMGPVNSVRDPRKMQTHAVGRYPNSHFVNHLFFFFSPNYHCTFQQKANQMLGIL